MAAVRAVEATLIVRTRVAAAMAKAVDRSAVLASFVSHLDETDRDLLAELLDDEA